MCFIDFLSCAAGCVLLFLVVSCAIDRRLYWSSCSLRVVSWLLCVAWCLRFDV